MGVDLRKRTVSVKVDKDKENNKIHDPFFCHTTLHANSKQIAAKTFMPDNVVEKKCSFPKGLVNRITGSFLVTYRDKASKER